jgi:hypothetical protein
MIDQGEILWGVVAPPLLMLAGLALSATSRRWMPTGAVLAVVYALAHLGMAKWPSPGGNVHDWPAWIAVTGGVVTLCAARAGGPLAWRMILRLVIAGVAVWLMLRPQLHGGGTGAAVGLVAGLAIGWTVMILLWERAHAAATPGTSLIGLTTVAGLSAISLLMFNSLTHAQFAGILVAALGAALVVCWWRPAWWGDRTAVTVVALVLPALWLLGRFYADLPGWAVVLLALSGLAPWVGAHPAVRARAAWQRLAIVAGVALVLAAPVLAWGAVTSARAAGAQPEYGY